MRFVGPAAAIAVLLLADPATGHPAPFSYVDVHVEAAARVTVVVHVFDVAHELQLASPDRLLEAGVVGVEAERIIALVRDRIAIEMDGRALAARWSHPEPLPDRQSLRLHAQYEGGRPPGRVALTANLFPYDPQHQTFVNFYERGALRSQAILGRGREHVEYFAGTRQGAVAVMQKFVPAGFHHILIGPDHLLFLFGLLLLGGSLRRLALVVTAFTLAHSVTLTLAAVNLVTPPPHVVEPAIALSIIYVGADNLLVRGGRDVRVWIAFGFGLIHGFGFANVLREMDLPRSALAWSLFSFNLGIEIGQLLVVGLVASALAALRTRSAEASRRLAFAGSIAVIAAGAFWFIQRVFFSGGMA
jgi:hydrogenase/urease accessory protein HupE